jgi:hypothetical protein
MVRDFWFMISVGMIVLVGVTGATMYVRMGGPLSW